MMQEYHGALEHGEQIKLSPFAQGVVEAMLWSNDLEAFDIDTDDLAALAGRADALETEAATLWRYTGKTAESNGQTAWLDGTGHGVGFWSEGFELVSDRALADDLGATLSRFAHRHFYGLEPYLGDDGRVYIVGLERVK